MKDIIGIGIAIIGSLIVCWIASYFDKWKKEMEREDETENL